MAWTSENIFPHCAERHHQLVSSVYLVAKPTQSHMQVYFVIFSSSFFKFNSRRKNDELNSFHRHFLESKWALILFHYQLFLLSSASLLL
jgi:hypothetical protein